MSKALVIFSGGQDSTTCLGWAKNRYSEVTAIVYKYGQKHEVEIQQARKISEQMGVPLKEIDLSFYPELVHSALLGEGGDVNSPHEDNNALPASFVPNRNALFILLAHSLAQKIKYGTLVAGVCQADYSGYPDCREVFTNAIEKALNLGADQNIKLETPLMHLSKAEVFNMAKEEGVLDLVLKESHTCYNGSGTMNDWGRGCGNCPACQLREKGFNEFIEKFGEK